MWGGSGVELEMKPTLCENRGKPLRSNSGQVWSRVTFWKYAFLDARPFNGDDDDATKATSKCQCVNFLNANKSLESCSIELGSGRSTHQANTRVGRR